MLDPLGTRIMVVGPSGSGKTTLGCMIGSALGLPFVDLDTLFWKPNWVKPEAATFQGDVEAATAGHAWVTAGNYRLELEGTLWQRADTVVWIDLPLGVVVVRILRRAWRRSRSGELVWGTNRENFWRHLKLWDDGSLVAWVVRSHRRRRMAHAQLMHDQKWAHLQIVRLRSAREVKAFVRSLSVRQNSVSW